MLFSSARHFRLWDYTVSHQQLLIRSARDESVAEDVNIDVVFSGVFYLALCDIMEGLEIDVPTPDELRTLQAHTGFAQDATRRFYILVSGGRRHVVGAAFFHVLENKLGSKETSLDFPNIRVHGDVSGAT